MAYDAIHSLNTPLEGPRYVRPLVKWAGGKRWLLDDLLPELGLSAGRYYEPFIGGAAVFLGIQPHPATLSDLNPELICFYLQVRDNPEKLIRLLQTFPNSPSFYYAMRQARPRGQIQRAARFYYLMRLSFNGLYRVNRSGEFNVPYGKNRRLIVCDAEHIRRVSEAFQGVTFTVGDFESETASATNKDTIYFDPPYTVAHGTNGFLKYNEQIFSWADQVRLANHARLLIERGARVVVSNADHPSIRKLYEGFTIRTVRRFSSIAASGEHRKPVSELLISWGTDK